MNSAAPDARGVSQARRDAAAGDFRGYFYIAVATFCWALAAVLARAIFGGRPFARANAAAIGPLVLSQTRTSTHPPPRIERDRVYDTHTLGHNDAFECRLGLTRSRPSPPTWYPLRSPSPLDRRAVPIRLRQEGAAQSGWSSRGRPCGCICAGGTRARVSVG